jgi:hypothetical protein
MAELDKKHEPKINAINKRSHRFIVAKFWVLILAASLFIIGLFEKTPIIEHYFTTH